VTLMSLVFSIISLVSVLLVFLNLNEPQF
jgi:hypothetical protein